MTSNSNRRSRTEIVIQIVESVNDHCKNGHGVEKTELMYEVFLNSDQLNEYLAALTAYSLLRYDPPMHTYNITKKGLRFLELWHNLSEMADESQPQQLLQMWIEREGGEEEF